MNRFAYIRAGDVATAVAEAAGDPTARFIAGGTNLLDLMKEDVERPGRVIDITRLALRDIEPLPDGGLRLGALATNSEVAYHRDVERRYPLLSQAILAGASPQLRKKPSSRKASRRSEPRSTCLRSKCAARRTSTCAPTYGRSA